MTVIEDGRPDELDHGEGLADRYAFASGAAGKQRLDVVSAVMHERTTALLDRVGVTAGGTVVTEDVDASASFCHPYSPVFHRAVTLFRDAVRHRGGNPEIGPALPSLLDLRRSAHSMVPAGLATEAEVEQLTADLTTYVADPGTVVTSPHIVQAWALAR